MTTPTPQQIEERFRRLPSVLRDAMVSPDVAHAILEIGKKYGLTIEKIGFLAEEAGLVVLGLTHPYEFTPHLKERLKINDDTAREIATRINHQIFYPLREALKNTHQIEIRDEEFQKEEVGVKKPVPSPPPKPTPAPAPPAPTQIHTRAPAPIPAAPPAAALSSTPPLPRASSTPTPPAAPVAPKPSAPLPPLTPKPLIEPSSPQSVQPISTPSSVPPQQPVPPIPTPAPAPNLPPKPLPPAPEEKKASQSPLPPSGYAQADPYREPIE